VKRVEGQNLPLRSVDDSGEPLEGVGNEEIGEVPELGLSDEVFSEADTVDDGVPAVDDVPGSGDALEPPADVPEEESATVDSAEETLEPVEQAQVSDEAPAEEAVAEEEGEQQPG
jgi:hypothetical protein